MLSKTLKSKILYGLIVILCFWPNIFIMLTRKLTLKCVVIKSLRESLSISLIFDLKFRTFLYAYVTPRNIGSRVIINTVIIMPIIWNDWVKTQVCQQGSVARIISICRFCTVAKGEYNNRSSKKRFQHTVVKLRKRIAWVWHSFVGSSIAFKFNSTHKQRISLGNRRAINNC